jgi:hypothetical protein
MNKRKWVALVGTVLLCLCPIRYSVYGTQEVKQVRTAARIELHGVRETRTASNDNASAYVGYTGGQRYIIEADDDCLIQDPDDVRLALTILKKKGLSDEAGRKLGRELLQNASQPIFLVH